MKTNFSNKTLKALARKGINVIGECLIPDEHGSFLNPITGVKLDDNGTHRIVLWLDVLEMAK